MADALTGPQRTVIRRAIAWYEGVRSGTPGPTMEHVRLVDAIEALLAAEPKWTVISKYNTRIKYK